MVYNHTAMTLLKTKLAVPLESWEDGTIRITGSRVTLDSIIHHFKLGATAEQIQDSFPSLALREIYGAIFYYLEHTSVVEEYLHQQEAAEEETRRELETRPDTSALRERIRQRRSQLVKR